MPLFQSIAVAYIKRRQGAIQGFLIINIPVKPLNLTVEDIYLTWLFSVSMLFSRILNQSNGRMIILNRQ